LKHTRDPGLEDVLAEDQNETQEATLSLSSTDLARTADFYGRLFGWRIEGDDESISCTSDGQHVGSFRLVEEMPTDGSSALPLIAVTSIDDTLRDVLEMEGGVVEPKTEVENVGWMARFADPDGNIIGLVEIRAEP
jgi:predicted enzyme related to lactoylglutathione lyase